MAINNVSVQYNGGFLPDIILLTRCDGVTALGNPFDIYHEEFFCPYYYSQCSHLD